MFIWNTHSLPHSLLICICLLACLLARTATIYNTYTMILAKRSRVYTVLLKQTNIWLCTIKNKQLIALLSVLFRFLHYFVIRCFDVRIEWTLCDGWSALSRRPSYVSPCMRCCFSFCLCEAFGGYKYARTHTMSTDRCVFLFWNRLTQTHSHTATTGHADKCPRKRFYMCFTHDEQVTRFSVLSCSAVFNVVAIRLDVFYRIIVAESKSKYIEIEIL